jgi:acyl-CoA reductase-like NAD-dependent aldehyde dehydrogenase
MLKDAYPFYLANEPATGARRLAVHDKFTGEVAAHVHVADADAIESAIEAAVAAETPMRLLPAHRRQAVLKHCVARFTERRDELADALCIEAGKPIKDSRGEVARLIDTFSIAAEDSASRSPAKSCRSTARPPPKDASASPGASPIGACSFISPFNFPLNLAAHKVAPALAVGCPFVLKPASLTPIGALIIGEILAETDLPRGRLLHPPLRPRRSRRCSPRTRGSSCSASPARPTSAGRSKPKAGKKRSSSNSAATPPASSTATPTSTTASSA